MEVLERLESLGGVARRSELPRTAADQRVLRDGVQGGRLRDLGSGWMAAVDASPAMVAARQFRGAITCVSAAPFYNLAQLRPPDRSHVAIPRSRGVRQAPYPVAVHREGAWTPPDGLPIAPLVDVLHRVLRCRPADEAVVMIDSALNKRLITIEQIAGLLRGPGSPRARATLQRCHPGSRSPIETLARLALTDAGLEVEAAVVIPGVGEVDLLVEGRVVVECDGFAYHSGRREYREDRRRDRELAAKGYVVLRFTWEEIMASPEAVVRAVLQVLRP